MVIVTYKLIIVALNENEGKHYISPMIFHDESTKDSTINHEETILSYMLKNPYLIFAAIILGYYIYPTLWNKEYFTKLSSDRNNQRILANQGQDIYDYINYRRGLYVSVRSNFS
jgi:hypothetical protein